METNGINDIGGEMGNETIDGARDMFDDDRS